MPGTHCHSPGFVLSRLSSPNSVVHIFEVLHCVDGEFRTRQCDHEEDSAVLLSHSSRSQCACNLRNPESAIQCKFQHDGPI